MVVVVAVLASLDHLSSKKGDCQEEDASEG